jgi:sigma-B regulation protein RsbU (phosphoserine phosphatase)
MMADVSGHGLAAALLTSVAKVLFRTGAEQCHEPAKLLQWLNRQIASYLVTGEFLTVFIGLWNFKSHQFSYAGAGHPPALLFGPTRRCVQRLRVSPGIVGIRTDTEFSPASVRLSVGERIVCYTDGLIESMNASSELFGEDGLIAVCKRWGSEPVEKMVKYIFDEVDRFCTGEPQRDDQALLVLEVTD